MSLYKYVDTGVPLLSIGSKGHEVRELQHLLGITVDGHFGPATDRAVRDYQRTIGLVADGIAGPKTMAVLRVGETSRLLRHSDIVRAANDLIVPVASVLAVNEVESRGLGFLDSGDPVILFERHIMRRMLRKGGVDTASLERKHPDLVNRKTGGYAGGQAEHDRLDRARLIDPEAAIQSASWGLFQIMGFHCDRLGYDSPHDWEEAMRESEGNQLDAFVRFVLGDYGMLKALRERNWAGFARRYNGPAYAKNKYDVKMARAYKRHSQAA